MDYTAPAAKASPLPLGFVGLFVATTTYAVIQLGWVPEEGGVTAAVVVLTATVGSQFLAAAVGFAAGNTTAGTAMGILAGTWAAVGVTTLLAGSLAPNDILGVALLCAGAAMLVPALAGNGPPIAAVVMATTCVRFVVTGIAEISGAQLWMTLAGVVGLVLAAVSFYAAVALEAASTGRADLPLTGGR